MAFVYQNGKIVVSQKMPNISLPIAAGQDLQLRINGNNSLGSWLTVVFLLEDGQAVKASIRIPASELRKIKVPGKLTITKQGKAATAYT